MLKLITHELKHHLPFTSIGALAGVILMIFLKKLPYEVSYKIFYVLHPTHVFLSALATASMYAIHQNCRPGQKCNHWVLWIVGYLGSVGIATLSDSLIPFWGESLLELPQRQVHIGFIEEWWLVNPLALLGIAIAYYRPNTQVSHTGHVLVSTWASLFHVLMALGATVSLMTYPVIFVFLILAVWLPCCVSDIVFPLLFVKKKD